LSIELTGSERAIMRVFDASGRLVASPTTDRRRLERGRLSWDARDRAGRRVPAGVYFIEISDGRRELTRKVTVLR
jgi:hypothetical protein